MRPLETEGLLSIYNPRQLEFHYEAHFSWPKCPRTLLLPDVQQQSSARVQLELIQGRPERRRVVSCRAPFISARC